MRRRACIFIAFAVLWLAALVVSFLAQGGELFAGVQVDIPIPAHGVFSTLLIYLLSVGVDIVLVFLSLGWLFPLTTGIRLWRKSR